MVLLLENPAYLNQNTVEIEENLLKRRILAFIAPPIAVCKFGCASCCAAPIGVFWIAGLISLIYAFFGGPAGTTEFSPGTFLLGVILWGIATTWTELTINGVDADDQCDEQNSSLCRMVKPKADDGDPMDEIKKFQ